MWRGLVLLLAAGALSGQETAMARLQREAVRVKKAFAEKPDDTGMATGLHAALRDWIDLRLPGDKGLLAVQFSTESAMQAELKEAGLGIEEADDDIGPVPGGVSVSFKRLPELPDVVFVTAGVAVPCGVDEAVYMYRFDSLGRKRVMDDHPRSAWGYSYTGLRLSDPDTEGRRLLLTTRMSVQCASTWMGMAYSVYRLGGVPALPNQLLAEQHGFWLDDGPEYVLKPDELLVEFKDRSVDSGVHNRTQIWRFRFTDRARRLEPVAFQPQDFAEEWLSRPWNEMEPLSARGTDAWHAKLHEDFVLADYSAVVPCASRPGLWLIGLDITHLGEKEFPEPLERYFLVRDLGQYRYRMEVVADSRPKGCPGAAGPSDKHPWLSPEELRGLK